MTMVATLPVAVPVVADDCPGDWLGVEEIRYDDNIELHASNLKSVPITFTLRVRADGMAPAGSRTVTETLGPHESECVLSLDDSAGGGKSGYRVSCKWTIGRQDVNHDDDHLYALPYRQGRAFRVLQGYNSHFSHNGLEQFAIDFDMPAGTAVHAARAGVVARVVESHDRGCWEDGCGKFANFIVVLHTDGTTGEYYHLQQHGALVEVGDSVARGQKIGLSGNTGHTTMPHLHFAVYRATDWGRTQSIPVRFQSADGVVSEPRRGARYTAQ